MVYNSRGRHINQTEGRMMKQLMKKLKQTKLQTTQEMFADVIELMADAIIVESLTDDSEEEEEE